MPRPGPIRRFYRSTSRHWLTGRRCACVLLIGVYVATVSGVPLPAPKRSSPNQPAKGGELFPCATSHCGCNSAERCWQSCCCHTLAERLAWARENGVRPPEFALAAARRSGLDLSWLAAENQAGDKAKTCCATQRVGHSSPGCCQKAAVAPAAPEKSCCAKHDAPASLADTAHDSQSDSVLVGWRALACNGQSLDWLAAVPTLVSVRLELADQLPLVAWLGPPTCDLSPVDADAPTPPPPQCA